MLRSEAKLLLLLAAGAIAAACSAPQVGAGITKVDLKIKSVSPDTVFNEGGKLVTLTTENGCAKEKMTVKVGSVPVTIDSSALDTYTFTAPAFGQDSRTSVELSAECSEHPSPADHAYGVNKASAQFTYDPSLEPQPEVKTYGPFGDKISVLSKMVVTFTRDMKPESVNADTVHMQGITGKTVYDAGTFTATFTPDEQLPYGTPQTCVVVGGANGVHSKKTGKELSTHLRPGGGTADPTQDSWTFTTRCEGCGNPWSGEISAAAGISKGSGYKLFSVTGQPMPVGEAFAGTPANHTYKLQSGFLYATQPGAQH
jgi:hypothetical protein